MVFSALDASVAGDIEQAFAAAGHVVVSNARNYRMDPLVPLLIPEVNADHLSLVTEQRRAKGWQGAIVTNPNCSTIVLAMALAPLRSFDLRTVIVSTMQAVSGAGYPGVPSLDILGNVVPFIGGEEEKMESETLKILGTRWRTLAASGHRQRAHQSRGGHRRPHHDGVRGFRREARRSTTSSRALETFRGRPQELDLPSAPKPPIVVAREQRPPAAAARCRSRRRHGHHRWTRAPLQSPAREAGGARAQYGPRRRRRGDSQRRADGRGGILRLKS